MKRTKYALITGASRGIGAAIARTLAQNGYHLYLVCHTQSEQLQLIKKELETAYSVSCTCYCGDISDSSFTASVFRDINQLDVLINNAGIAYYGLLQDMSDDSWNKIIATNLSSAFYTSKNAIPFMLSNHSGHIINISSVWGNVGASMEVAYSASKGGLNSFTKALAKELAPSEISVNAIACGMIDTDMNSILTLDDISAVCDEIPVGRMAQPEEVAKTVLNLIQMPSYLTGQIITLDGGWT